MELRADMLFSLCQTNRGFRIDSGVRQGCIMPPWFFNVYMDAVMEKVKMGMGTKGVIFL